MSSDDRNKTVFRPSPLQGGSRKPSPPPSQGAAPFDSGWDSVDSTPPPEQPPPSSPNPGAPPAADPFGDMGGQRPQAANPDRSVRFSDNVPQPPQAPEERNSLTAHAAPVLAMAAAIQSGRWQVPMSEFYAEAKRLIAKFETAIEPLYPEPVRQRARFAVCATIDDVAQNLPGKEADAAQWARRSMEITFFRENIGGDRFWGFVDEMLRDPARNRDLIELFHACLAAGFEGRTRTMPDGHSRKAQVMASLVGALDHVRSLSQHEVTDHWQGVDRPRRPNNFWGVVAIFAAVAGGILFLLYLTFFVVLMAKSDEPASAVAGLFPDEPLALNRSAPPVAIPPSSIEVRLRRFLASEIEQGLVEVEGNRVRTTVGTLFAPASESLVEGRSALFQKIGEAAERETGAITIEGHADSDRISARSIAFPDNLALSEARAKTVAELIRGQIRDPSRVRAVGIGDTRPIASNETAEGKAMNRRVEIVFDHGL